jgi:hypothetical protein
MSLTHTRAQAHIRTITQIHTKDKSCKFGSKKSLCPADYFRQRGMRQYSPRCACQFPSEPQGNSAGIYPALPVLTENPEILTCNVPQSTALYTTP